MSQPFVIDASVALAWVLPSQATVETEELLDEIESGTRPVVPSLWLLEVSNALLVLERRRRIRADERKEALATLQALNLAVDNEGPGLAFTRVADLATSHRLSVYDAIYLELALRKRLVLATKDKSLRAAARQAGATVR